MQRTKKKKKINAGGSPETRIPPVRPVSLKELSADKARLKTLTARQLADLLSTAPDQIDTDQWVPIAQEVGGDTFFKALALLRAEISQPEALDLVVGGDLNAEANQAYEKAVREQQDGVRIDIDDEGVPRSTDDIDVNDNTAAKRKVANTPQQKAPPARNSPATQNSPPKPSSSMPPQSTPAATEEGTQTGPIGQLNKIVDRVRSRGDDSSPAAVHVAKMRKAVSAAMDTERMKQFDSDTLATLADIMARRLPADVAQDPDVREFARTARTYLTGLRNPQEFDGTGRPSIADRRRWVKSMAETLAAEGFNDNGQLRYLFQNINTLLNALEANSGDGASWAKLSGYIFQLNQTAKALREYRLKGVEVPISADDAGTYQETRYVDTRELVFSTKEGKSVERLREYKAYADHDTVDPDFETKFTAQLQDYVKMAIQDDDLPNLNYVFSDVAPSWARKKLAAAAKTLDQHGRNLYLTERGSTSVITGGTVLSMQQAGALRQQRTNTAPPNLNAFSDAPVPMAVDDTSNDNGPARPRTPSITTGPPTKVKNTPTATKPQKAKRKLSDRKPPKSTKKKKNEVPANNLRMDQFVIRTPSSNTDKQ